MSYLETFTNKLFELFDFDEFGEYFVEFFPGEWVVSIDAFL